MIKMRTFIILKYNNKAVSINNISLSYITKYTALFWIILSNILYWDMLTWAIDKLGTNDTLGYTGIRQNERINATCRYLKHHPVCT